MTIRDARPSDVAKIAALERECFSLPWPEEIIASLVRLCSAEDIALASVSAIGAVGAFTVGVFSPEDKTYKSNAFKGDYEIVSLVGTVTKKDDSPYVHLHMSAGDSEGRVFGGHLNSAVVSATCEMVIEVLEGRIDRKFSEEIGLNLLEF